VALKDASSAPDIGFDDFSCTEQRWIRQTTQDSKAAELTLNRASSRSQASGSNRTQRVAKPVSASQSAVKPAAHLGRIVGEPQRYEIHQRCPCLLLELAGRATVQPQAGGDLLEPGTAEFANRPEPERVEQACWVSVGESVPIQSAAESRRVGIDEAGRGTGYSTALACRTGH